MKSRHITNLILVLLVLLIPIVALDLFQSSPKTLWNSDQFTEAGDKEAAAGNFNEALINYNKAEEKVTGTYTDKYETMAAVEQKKANAYSGLGDTAAAANANRLAENYLRDASDERVGCLIATATFDSPLAPQVQQLREFRQNTIYSTESGTQFMTAFNAWYYSFSPVVADFIDDHPQIKPPMRVILTPLLGILTLAQMSFSVLSVRPDIAVIVSGLVASTLIGIIYAFPVLFVLLLVIRKFYPVTVTTGTLKIAGISAIAGLYFLVAGDILLLSPFLLVGSVLFVVSLVVVTGLYLSGVCMNRLDHRSAPIAPE
jgi:hypothetical protein